MSNSIEKKWDEIMSSLPYRKEPYSKKNWGHPNHSLCSYQGKLKPAIAHFLVNTFVPKNGRVLDPFAGVGTIPFEAALSGRTSYGIDISPLAYFVSSAKVNICSESDCIKVMKNIEVFIKETSIPKEYSEINGKFGFNKALREYFHPDTFKEILLSRMYFQQHYPKTPADFVVVSSLLHILHGNRPYALSRQSHPIVPYAPTGNFTYKNLIEKLSDKVLKTVKNDVGTNFKIGTIFKADSTLRWDDSISELDAIITSPPFFDSTRFYVANWIRLWFLGWSAEDFVKEAENYVDEKQKQSFDVYDGILEQGKERLKTGGYFVMHLGKSKKCDMGLILQEKGKKWFSKSKLYNEDVSNCNKFGIKDVGATSSHQYLVMR